MELVVKDGETRTSTAVEKTNKQKKKTVLPTVKELQMLGRDFIVQCDPSTVYMHSKTFIGGGSGEENSPP